MVHRIFKSIVPQTNLKNVSLDLLKHYTTLFAIRHLLDGGIDPWFCTLNNGFVDLSKNLKRMMNNWFITKDKVDSNKDDISEGTVYDMNVLVEIYNLHCEIDLSVGFFKVFSPDEQMSSISLKKRVLRRDIERSVLSNIQAELKLAYEDLGINSAILDGMPIFFEYASFNFLKENGDNVLCHLHVGDVVSIKIEEGENYAMIKAIFSHQQEDGIRFAFVTVDWFEDKNQRILGCPVFRSRNANNWRKVFSINLVNAINTTHFVHNCKGEECVGGVHDLRNSLYIRNIYFFNFNY